MGWLFKSRREKIDNEVRRLRSLNSQAEYELSNVRQLRNSFTDEKAAIGIRDRIISLIDQILRINWGIFTVENLASENYFVNQSFSSNEAHNLQLYSEEKDNKGFLVSLRETKMLVASITPSLAVHSESMQRARKFSDPLGLEQAIKNYLDTIERLEYLLTGITKDISDALKGENALLCGLNISGSSSYMPRKTGVMRKWAMRLALAGVLSTVAGFTATSPRARGQVGSVIRNPGQHIKIAALGITDVRVLQEKVDQINNKIKKHQTLDEEEIAFLQALYHDIATGGAFRGLGVASRFLAHYVDGTGTTIEVEPEIYTNCPGVQLAMKRMKEYILENVRTGRLPAQGRINSTDKPVRKALGGKSRDTDYQNSGILPTGYVKSGVADSRATFYANRRFPLTASYTMRGDQLVIDWSVTDVYDFRDKGNMSTLIPMPGGTLKLWDRISCAIATTAEGSTSLDPFAREFSHTAQWTTVHRAGEQLLASNQ